MRAQPNMALLLDTSNPEFRHTAYLWYEADDAVTSRYFFSYNGSLVEDPGTGSACANLGAWAHLHQHAPLTWKITQAEAIDRPNHLYLNVSADGLIQVGGRVMPFAHGELSVF